MTPGIHGRLLIFGLLMYALGLNGCATHEPVPPGQQAVLEQMLIGKTASEEAAGQLGKPKAIHTSFTEEGREQSWAYSYALLGTNPFRYLPFVGAAAVADVADVENPSFAINFSEKGTLQGFTQRKISRYTIEPAWPGNDEEVTPYGWRNLNTRLAVKELMAY